MNYKDIRNVAVIAHVDHGKTTLVSGLLVQSGMDSVVVDHNDLEKERGITILSKCTSLVFNGIKYNLIDTPGHADFGGEVERVLSVVEGVILLVDSSEGAMPQTKFVLSKALKVGLKPIVVVNKIDRQDRRIDGVLDEIVELFMALDATDEQLNFPILYAVGRDGWATLDVNIKTQNFDDLFNVMRDYVPHPVVDESTKEFTMSSVILSSDKYLGKLIIGKVYSGVASVGATLKSINLSGEVVENIKLQKLFEFHGLNKVSVESVAAGDIVCIAGVQKTTISDTICSINNMIPIASIPVDPPTMSVTISVNDSPLAGTEGSKLTSRMILERLEREAETNVAIKLVNDGGDKFILYCRGELQLSIILENMRREGFEVSVSRPEVVMQQDEDGKLEPVEEVVIDVEDEYTGVVIEKLSLRKGEVLEMKAAGYGKTRLILKVPTRGLIGYQSEFRNDTRGTGIMNHCFFGYERFRGKVPGRRNGALISMASGEAVAFALCNLEERGSLFIGAKDKVYEGMIIGECNREGDLDVNPIKGKQLSNVRAAGSDENIRLTPARRMNLEEYLSYIQDDELLEITPANIRIRKKELIASKRKRK
ncbi:GTP-binding protein TypA/BipA [Candidatus Fokinia solitaria]|uniref:50S ribosomal subunit assembly factor BipA n=1 Tax=Candidatus Fokinia solitaria TaxID=1802984 RepID=A0A2U8BSG2_9RICK|nr:translational GTPase TypA [Candidatus Fokinia solitaria]AWD33238.1 GTP-binding protein TypA/BipA [Candidatus Fokinia solitaria]